MKILIHIRCFLRRQLLMLSDNMQPVFLQKREQRTVIGGILQIHQFMDRHMQRF